MVYPRRGGFVITAKQDLYIPSREAEADGSGTEEKRRGETRTKEEKGWARRRQVVRQVDGARTNETGEKGPRERAAKVSLILISISWCDVYLTTTAWSRERASVVFLSLHPRGAHRLEFLARCFIQGHRGPLPGQERAAALPSAV